MVANILARQSTDGMTTCRAHGVGKLYQHARPEIIVEHGIVDQVD
jgi:hypothetical protein